MQITWGNTIPVWWSFFWRAVLYGALLGAVLGFVSGAYLAVTGQPDKANLYGTVAGYIGAIPASMLALKQAISKHLDNLVVRSGASAS